MKTPLSFASLAIAVVLAGCAAPAPAPAPAASPAAAAPVAAPAPAPVPVAECNADGARFAVGQQITPPLEAAARVRAGADSARVIKPGDAITMEINNGRLNLEVDARSRVTGVRCG